MAVAIWKFPFEVTNRFTLKMPEATGILCVQVQNGQPCIWAIVNPTLPYEDRRFIVHGTGHPFDTEEGLYIGTFQLMEGRFVGHLFEAN